MNIPENSQFSMTQSVTNCTSDSYAPLVVTLEIVQLAQCRSTAAPAAGHGDEPQRSILRIYGEHAGTLIERLFAQESRAAFLHNLALHDDNVSLLGHDVRPRYDARSIALC